MRLVAKDVLKLAGFEPKQIGKVSVSVSGITVRKAMQVLNLQDDKEVVVVFGNESVTKELPAELSQEMLSNLEEAKKMKGEESLKKAAILKEKKAKAKVQAEKEEVEEK